jgi:nicotinic acid mononucleotide adenylyltransferase
LDALRLVIPPEKLGRPAGRVAGPAQDSNRIVLHKSAIHLMDTVASHVSSTEVRDRLEQCKSIHGLVPARVEEYILGQALYR